MRRRGLLLATAAAALAAPVAAPAAQAPTIATVTMREWRFTVAPRTVPAGTVVFRVTNAGTIRHNFVVAGKRTRALSPGRSQVLRVTFRRPGPKAYLCTLPSHAEAGMRGRVSVG